MRKFIPGSLFIILPGLILFLFSCNGSCFEETESYLKATFYTGPPEHRIALAPDTLTLYGLNNDSILYYKAIGVKVALFPLNASSDSSTFVIIINGITDTIKFRYNSFPHLISKECGYTFYHHLDTAFMHHHDHYESNKNITNLNVENIRIFY